MSRVTTTRYFAAAVVAAFAASAFAGDMSSAEKIKKMDRNGDGVLSAAEHDAKAREMFQTMDANKDGNVTAAEMDASHEMMRKDHSMHGMKTDERKAEESTANPKEGGL